MQRYLPARALGFARNPFGSLHRDEWADITVLPAALRDIDGHLQILGARGRGKTSLLHALTDQHQAAGRRAAYERLAVGQHRYHTAPGDLDVFLLDEAQRLGPFARWRLLRAGRRCRLVLGSHRDIRRAFVRHGLALASVRLEDLITPAHVRAVIARRLAYFALDDPPPVTLTPAAYVVLWERCGSDLRAAINVLYDAFQQRRTPGAITARELAEIAANRTPP